MNRICLVAARRHRTASAVILTNSNHSELGEGNSIASIGNKSPHFGRRYYAS
jgi:hypothetical protein